MISLSLRSTAHPKNFQLQPVGASIPFYRNFTLAMDRSPGFGSTTSNYVRPFKTRFRFGSTYRLNLATDGNSRTHYAKGTQSACSLKSIGLPQLVGKRFQVLFHSPPGVLFAFPSRYWFTIGLLGVFSLTGWSPWILTGFLVSRHTQDSADSHSLTRTRLSRSTVVLSRTFPVRLCFNGAVLQPRICRNISGLGFFLFARRY